MKIQPTCDGEATFITVDSHRVLETTVSELEFIDNYTLTFKVDFMGEASVDLGGPRREWIRLDNREMKTKYFDNGLRQYILQEYFYVGIMIAMLQNGQMPAFIEDHILQEILSPNKSLKQI
ncbi:Fibronectin type 3 and ankyrin repeat domains protein 1 [Desmophyllum pertusum]|uniref:Fibronectin type 3 and ankyrin repeat domains protein 1 n=1 Tax=Desmophyllum pertusum TaxID=174260 RepID=A0A9W9YKJ2_9CNID|nr:Fibronectin type 3 and ankyrin repeat domains protein 1 [Desmophyllum pertusum]